MGLFSLLADVLFVGHSLVGPNLPPMLEATLQRMGQPASVHAQIINGAPLGYNWDKSAEAEGTDARAWLKDRGSDVLILTEAQPVAGHIEFSATVENVVRFASLAHEKNPDTRVYLYETWPSLNSGPGADTKSDRNAATPWRERLALELPLWESVVSEASAQLPRPVTLIPAGQAMGALADTIRNGDLLGVSDISELFGDDIHPSGKAIYFLALVHAAVLTGESPEGLPAKVTRAWASRDAVITDAQAAVMQRIAWAVVQGYTPAPAQVQAAPVAPPPVVVAGEEAPFPSFPAITNQKLALGLVGVNDWSVQQPFLDVMKTARPWIGHFPGQWGGWTEDDLTRAGALDAQGWPTRLPPELTSIATLILTDLPSDAGGVAGRYLLRHQGKGVLQVGGRGQVVSAAAGQILFDYTPGEGGVLLTLTQIDSVDPIREITVVRANRAADLDAGEVFNPDWISRIQGVSGVRFMDWMLTNNSTLSDTADRPLPSDYSYARNGVPIEVMVALANGLQADPWFTIPHLATDDFIRTYAQIARDQLDPNLNAQVEFSNEVWNWQFGQAQWAEAQGKARWGKDGAWVQFYALRAAQMADIWAEVFKATPDRLTRIIAVQTGWLGLESQILDAPLVVAEGLAPPVQSFDAYAVTGYFSGGLGGDAKYVAIKDWLRQSRQAALDQAALEGLKGGDAEAYARQHRYDLAIKLAAQEIRDGSVTGDGENSIAHVLTEILPYHASIAADRGLRLMMYEGGTHVVGLGGLAEDEELTAFFTALNFSAEMGALYAQMLAGWQLQSEAPFNAFVDIYRPGKWGSWGALRHLTDDNPRWDALVKGCITC